MWVIGGVAAQIASVAALREANSRSSRSAWLVGGISLYAISIWLISQQLGFELGLTWALVTISAIAYFLILHPFLRAQEIGHQRIPARVKKMPAPPSGSKARLALRLFSAGPLYLIASLGLSLLIATKPWAIEITRLFTGGLLVPLFWSFGALHATVDPNLWRVALAPVLITIFSAGVHFLI